MSKVIYGKCRDCKWFERNHSAWYEKSVIDRNNGECKKAHDWGGDCLFGTMRDDIENTSYFGSADHEGHYSVVIVGEDFGCIHFEAVGTTNIAA